MVTFLSDAGCSWFLMPFFFLSDENNLFLQCYSAVSALFSAGYGTTTLLVTLGNIKAYNNNIYFSWKKCRYSPQTFYFSGRNNPPNHLQDCSTSVDRGDGSEITLHLRHGSGSNFFTSVTMVVLLYYLQMIWRNVSLLPIFWNFP